MSAENTDHSLTDIALIGMAGRFPGAANVAQFWRNLRDGVNSVTFFSDAELEAAGVDAELREDPRYVKAGAVLEGVELFDASFFGYTRREAEIMDPQHRIFLECAWEALEHAGYDGEAYEGRVGVYAGASLNRYLLNVYSNPEIVKSTSDLQILIGNKLDHLAPRVSYKLNLKGPSINLQSACSTSLVAVGIACQSLLSYQCDMALAGAASIQVRQGGGYMYEEGGILSPDGYCRAFDAKAAGTVVGSGVGVVVLKRLADALADGDTIHAVIKGAAINNDGSFKVGYTAPSAEGQSEVISEALAMAGVEPETVGYVETHGTGTVVGDPIEFSALARAFEGDTTKRNFCAIGSVKTNIGHLDAAAGVAGLIKTTLAIAHGQLPPSLHYERPNPAINFAESPFYVSARLSEWKTEGTPRRAGVSSFGIGGTNAHVVLEEAPAPAPVAASRPFHLLTISAKTKTALEVSTANLLAHLKEHPENDLASVAYTLQVGRKTFSHRRVVICRGRGDAVESLESLNAGKVSDAYQEGRERPLVFMFPGQGTQHAGMARELYEREQVFREQIDLCARLLKPHLKLDLREILYPSGDEKNGVGENVAAADIDQTAVAQPGLFVVEYALARLWMAWGVLPEAMIGHSIGEYVAACLAGVMSLEDALRLVATRGRLMQQLPRGSMLAVSVSEREAQAMIRTDAELSLAAVNAPSRCVVSGTTEAVGRLEKWCVEQDIPARRLRTSHAFHSQMMEPLLDEFAAQFAQVKLSAPQLPFISNVTGTWITTQQATDPLYWTRQLRQTVRFADGVAELLKRPERVLLEAGPGRTLASQVKGLARESVETQTLSSLRHPREETSDLEVMLRTLGGLWLSGVKIDWAGFHAHERLRRIPLPTYPFERQRYWIDARPLLPAAAEQTTPESTTDASVTLAATDTLAATEVNAPAPFVATGAEDAPRDEREQAMCRIWQEVLGVARVGIHDNFFELGGDSLAGIQLMSRLREAFALQLPMVSLFESPTVAGLAALVSESAGEVSEGEEDLEALIAAIEMLSPEEVDAAIEMLSPEEVDAAIAHVEEADEPSAAATVGGNGRQQVSSVSAQPDDNNGNGEGGSNDANAKAMKFSLFFFSDDGSKDEPDKYRLLLESAKFADAHDFSAVWTPERHFQDFGGLYPNPAVLAAALATITERIQLRAGSVALPLHNPIRVAEEWSVVDNLSRGRVGVSFASGWHPLDFVLLPANYQERKEKLFDNIRIIQNLWSGGSLAVTGVDGLPTEVKILPRPIQTHLPTWITIQGSTASWIKAGEMGAHVLTSIVKQPLDVLAGKIRLYRETLARHGHDPAAGQVAAMLHTFLGEDNEIVKEQVRAPMTHYLRSNIKQLEIQKDMYLKATEGTPAPFDFANLTDADLDAVAAFAFEGYFDTIMLCGTPAKCSRLVDSLAAIGVDEIACLIDFGLPFDVVLGGLKHLSVLNRKYLRAADAVADASRRATVATETAARAANSPV
jgi:natural product biosynthesis luciferase-like monooxygenase protein